MTVLKKVWPSGSLNAIGERKSTSYLDIHSILWFNSAGFGQGTYVVKWAQG